MSRLNRVWTDFTSSIVPLARPMRVDHEVAGIRAAASEMSALSAAELQQRCDEVRAHVCRSGVDAAPSRRNGCALMLEALRRALGIELYDVQLQAALVLAGGGIAEMQTGEGKTFACAPAALLHALTGRGVHVATPNVYLAERDYQLLLPAYRLLGVTVGLLREQGSPLDKRQAYQCDVTYSTGHEFGFDYLRDQLTLRGAANQALGSNLLQQIAGIKPGTDPLLQRGLYYSIVDEADNVLLDDAVSPLILSGASAGEAPDAAVHQAAVRMARKLKAGEHFQVAVGSSGVRLTEAGIALIQCALHDLPIHLLNRTWNEYVEQAIGACQLRRDVHYVLDKVGKVQVVDTSTGRIFSDRTWRAGLHQAVEAKEGVRITSETQSLAQITRQRFSRLYERLAGMTGTASGCEREFRQVYRLQVHSIPLRIPSQRELWPARFFVNQQSKWFAIARSVEELHQQRRPVLIGTRSIADSERLAELFQERRLPFQLLNGRQDATEAAIIALAGHQRALTIATSLAGRGTDISLGSGVVELGGLHVIVSECDESARIDRQLIGRCARQGDPGTAQVFVSAEDALLMNHGAWLARSIVRHADSSGELKADLMPQICRIQRAAERLAGGARAEMLRRDLARDSLDTRSTLDS